MLAAETRVSALLFGAEDFALDLGLPARREAEASELLYARSAVVVAATGGVRHDQRDRPGRVIRPGGTPGRLPRRHKGERQQKAARPHRRQAGDKT